MNGSSPTIPVPGIAARYDLVAIGGGPAGQSASQLAVLFGRTALIVQEGPPGGVVTTTGGVPTKALRASVLEALGQRRSGEPPLSPERFDNLLPAVRHRTLEVRASMQDATAATIAASGASCLEGSARLLGGGRVCVTTVNGTRRTIEAGAVLVATGSRPARLPGIPYDDPDVLDSESVFGLEHVPGDVLIVGAGPVGIEFATVFAALGCSVTLLDGGSRLLPGMDDEIVDLLRESFSSQGITVRTGVTVEHVARIDDQLAVTLSTGETVHPEKLLLAAGRTPNTDDLGLSESGVECDDRGRVKVDRYYRTTSPGVYAAGDVVTPTLASVAWQQGRAAACHALGLVFGTAVDAMAGHAVYAVPEIAAVGATEEQLLGEGMPYAVGR